MNSPDLSPEYDLVHASLTLASALAELPSVYSGSLEGTSESTIGSNSSLPVADRKVPRTLVIGGSVLSADFDKVKAAIVSKTPDVRFIAVRHEQILAEGATGPNPEVVCKILRRKLETIK